MTPALVRWKYNERLRVTEKKKFFKILIVSPINGSLFSLKLKRMRYQIDKSINVKILYFFVECWKQSLSKIKLVNLAVN